MVEVLMMVLHGRACDGLCPRVCGVRIGDERVHLVLAVRSGPWTPCDLLSQHAVPLAETEHDPMGRLERNSHQAVAVAVHEHLPLLQREPGFWQKTSKCRVPVASFAGAETPSEQGSPDQVQD